MQNYGKKISRDKMEVMVRENRFSVIVQDHGGMQELSFSVEYSYTIE